MAHFAKLDSNNVVLEVHRVDNEVILDADGNESEELGVVFLTEWSGGYTNWKQTSYTGSFRKRYAGVGYTYDPIRDAFIPPFPYPSWVFNEETLDWDPPVPFPQDYGPNYGWDELNQQWIELE